MMVQMRVVQMAQQMAALSVASMDEMMAVQMDSTWVATMVALRAQTMAGLKVSSKVASLVAQLDLTTVAMMAASLG